MKYGKKYTFLIESPVHEPPAKSGCGCSTHKSDYLHLSENRNLVFRADSCSEVIEQAVLLKRSQTLVDDGLTSLLVKSRSETLGRSISSEVRSLFENLSFRRAVLSEYSETDIRSIAIPTLRGYNYVVYERAGKLIGGGLFIQISKKGNQTIVTYDSESLETIGSLTVENGVIIGGEVSFQTPPNTGGSTERKFGECVRSTLNRFTDGSTFGSIMGLGCMAFGVECAAGIAVGCAIQAL